MSNNQFFIANMKMSDLISLNYNLLTVLPRFDIKLGFGELTVAQVCDKYKADTNLFLLVCNLYTYNDFRPSIERLNIDVDNLVGYLMQSHRYYLSEKISSIEKQLNELSSTFSKEHKEILIRFFGEYKSEIIGHFDYEEVEVFPYVKSLKEGISSEYHIERFEENHSNIEDKLGDLKNILVKYLPPNDKEDFQRNNLLSDLFVFEAELDKHTLIEERILIPYVEQIERGLK